MGDLYVVIGGWGNEKKVGLYNDGGFVRYLPDLIMKRDGYACAGFQDRFQHEIFKKFDFFFDFQIVISGWILYEILKSQ